MASIFSQQFLFAVQPAGLGFLLQGLNPGEGALELAPRPDVDQALAAGQHLGGVEHKIQIVVEDLGHFKPEEVLAADVVAVKEHVGVAHDDHRGGLHPLPQGLGCDRGRLPGVFGVLACGGR